VTEDVVTKEDERRKHDLSRSVNYYALLIGVVACVNFWLYWANGSRLTLGLAIVCLVCLAGWLVAARRILRGPVDTSGRNP
jgi:hypothetical protein